MVMTIVTNMMEKSPLKGIDLSLTCNTDQEIYALKYSSYITSGIP